MIEGRSNFFFFCSSWQFQEEQKMVILLEKESLSRPSMIEEVIAILGEDYGYF